MPISLCINWVCFHVCRTLDPMGLLPSPESPCMENWTQMKMARKVQPVSHRGNLFGNPIRANVFRSELSNFCLSWNCYHHWFAFANTNENFLTQCQLYVLSSFIIQLLHPFLRFPRQGLTRNECRTICLAYRSTYASPKCSMSCHLLCSPRTVSPPKHGGGNPN